MPATNTHTNGSARRPFSDAARARMSAAAKTRWANARAKEVAPALLATLHTVEDYLGGPYVRLSKKDPGHDVLKLVRQAIALTGSDA